MSSYARPSIVQFQENNPGYVRQVKIKLATSALLLINYTYFYAPYFLFYI